MEVLIVENAAAAAMVGAGRVAELLAIKPNAVLGLATGSTPIAVYQELVSRYRRDQISFANVVTFNLDEYVGLISGSPQSYRSFMDRELFDHVVGVVKEVKCRTLEYHVPHYSDIKLELHFFS